MLFDVFAMPGLQTFRQRVAAAVADPASIRLEYRRRFTHRAGREDFVRSAVGTFHGPDQRQIVRSGEVGIPIPVFQSSVQRIRRALRHIFRYGSVPSAAI